MTLSSVSDRFWSKVAKGDDCWEWQASIATTGYGQFMYEGRPHGAHRISWMLTNGDIPTGAWVLHKCDNRRCCRPDHLYLGDPAANARDTHGRGRWHYVPPGQGKSKEVAPPKKRGPQPTPPAERFWTKVDSQGGDVTPCWEWKGTRHKNGYGLFYMPDLKRKVVAHRIAYALHYGPFDRSLVVMHMCDNRGCCNPSHLRLGTIADNNRDRSSKGRGREARQWGASNPRSKLSEEMVLQIRTLAAEGITQIEIAAKFDVKQPQVSRLVRGVSWPDGPWPTQKGETR